MQDINCVEEHTGQIGAVYQEHYAELLDYFGAQLGNAREAEACAHKTIRRFFFFMEDRCWEADEEYVPVYLKRIAGGVFCESVSARGRLVGGKPAGLFGRMKNELIQSFKVRAEFVRLLLGAAARPGTASASRRLLLSSGWRAATLHD